MKELRVTGLKDGTVIDHIPIGLAFKLIDILDLSNSGQEVIVANNFRSNKMQDKKGIVKVAGKELSEKEIQKISLLVPDATINIINDYKVSKKYKITIPDEINNSVRCFNPVCITNKEDSPTRFHVVSKEPLKIKCHYCERIMAKENIQFL